MLCAKYLEYIIEERQEATPSFHDRLAELYLLMTLEAKRRKDDSKFQLLFVFFVLILII